MAMRDWFIRDLGWKFFSVLLAVVIWLTVSKIRNESDNSVAGGGQDNAIFGSVPVLIVSAAADVHNFKVSPEAVTVTISGPSEQIARLQASQIRAFVDLTGVEAGKLHRRVDVSVPSGLAIVKVNPPEVDVVVPPTHD